MKKSFFLILFVLLFENCFSQLVFRDEFQNINYNNNDGNTNWSGPWTEFNDNNSPVGGNIFINNNSLEFNDTNTGQNIRRTANLNGVTNATLSFNWQTINLDEAGNFREELGIFISDNPNNNFVNVANGTIIGTNTGFVSIDIPPALLTNQTTIAFAVIGGGNNSFEANELAILDNIQIQTNVEQIVISDETANESDGTITFTVSRITFPGITSNPFSVDFVTNNGSALSPNDYTAQNGTLNFSATDNTQTITISVIDNNFLTVDRNFFVDLSNAIGTNIEIIDNRGIGTIIEDPTDTPIPQNVPLTLFQRFNGLFDYSSTGDSFRVINPNDNTDECNFVETRPGVTLTSNIPTTATVESAFLFWAHSGFNPDTSVTFEGQVVEADIVNGSSINGSPLFGMVSDVTNIIQSIPINNLSTNPFELENLAFNNNNPFCAGTVALGGWSLMVFYTEPTLPASTIVLFNGFDGRQDDSESYTLDGFFAIGNADAKTSTLSWEGDIGLANNELLSITTGAGVTSVLNGDGDNDGTINNPFNSTVFDNTDPANIVNRTTLGLDLDTFDISNFITQGETSVTTNVDVGQDFVISNAVALKVPSNLMVGTVFEDINFPGGLGRDQASANGIPIPNVLVEIYRELPDGSFVFDDSDVTDANGEFVLGGMVNGTYRLKVVTNTVTSSRNGNSQCTPPCTPIQTFDTGYNGTNITPEPNRVGGRNPQAINDANAGVINGAQSFSTVTIFNEGVVDLDFGFNFNTIVNTNDNGQGSLRQFIINSNALGETGLDIEPHPGNPSLNPAAGDDTSIFNIPTTDTGFIDNYFDILIDSGNLPAIIANNTKIDGRTQTAFTGNTNIGSVGAGGTNVGTNASTLPIYELPEIQVRKNNTGGFSLEVNANNVTIRNLAVNGTNTNYDGIRIASGTSVLVTENLIGVLATGLDPNTNDRHGIRVNGGESTINGNYISGLGNNGIRINGGTTSSLIQNNHLNGNSFTTCDANINAQGGASEVTIQNNLIENGGNYGINNANSAATVISENTIQNTGALSPNCNEQIGIRLNSTSGNASVINNIISNNGREGIIITSTSSGNLISENSIFSNGITEPSLGIDINNNGVTINDLNDADGGPNEIFNFPIIETVTTSGNTLKLSGWARPGAIIEVFLSDIDTNNAIAGDNTIGSAITRDYGEGEIYLGTIIEGINDTDNNVSTYSDIDGNTDNTNRFNIILNLTNSIPIGSLITTTATNPGTNSTSEFGNIKEVRQVSVITNRRITDRITTN